MKIQSITILILLMFCSKSLWAQASIEGIWKGQSICQVKNSPCHDENVVYHISKDSVANHFIIVAYKIVNGKEDYMGTIKFTYDHAKSTLTSVDDGSNAKWEFKMDGTKMSGKLVFRNELFRLINVEKAN